jgi:hypothetical protein
VSMILTKHDILAPYLCQVHMFERNTGNEDSRGKIKVKTYIIQ